MIISKSIRLTSVQGHFDPSIISLGDYYVDEFRQESAEVIKISQYGIKVRYENGETRTFSTPDLYAHPNYTFIVTPKQHDLSELAEEHQKTFHSAIPEDYVTDPHLIRRWIYIRSTDTIAVIEGIDYRSQPITLFARVFPNGPLDYNSSTIIAVPVTEAELIQNFDVYSPKPSFEAPFETTEMPTLTGVLGYSSFDFSLKTIKAQFKTLPVYLPKRREIGLVTQSSIEGPSIAVKLTENKPLSKVDPKDGQIDIPLNEVVPLRDHRLVSSLYRADTLPSSVSLLGKICSRNWRYRQ